MNRADIEVLNEGFNAVSDWADSKARRRAEERAAEERRRIIRMQIDAENARAQADREMRERIAMKQIERENNEAEARRTEAKGRMDADAIRQWGKNWDAFGDYIHRETDPVTLLNREKAQRELDALHKTPTPNPDDAALEADVRRRKLKKEQETLMAPPPAPAVPMARVTQSFGSDGKSHAEFQVPLDQLKKTMGGSGYQSPYAEDIAELGRQIADQESEIEGGDERTGFLGIATSRQGIADQAKRKMRKLQALELQDQLAHGVIDQAEADRRADIILRQQ